MGTTSDCIALSGAAFRVKRTAGRSNVHSCKDAIDLLLGYLDGELAPDVKSKLEAHLGDCTPCEDFLKAYRNTPSVCRKALSAKMPSAMAESLSSFLRGACKKG